ncbi:phage tail assembly protein [Escherichia coli]|nr:phage tail assembly protein [Escherichia coli]
MLPRQQSFHRCTPWHFPRKVEIEGSGTIYGMYVIEGLNQTKTEFFRDGMPRRIEFTLSLKRVDESLSDMFGDLSAQLNNLQDTATSALSDISKTVGGLLS